MLGFCRHAIPIRQNPKDSPMLLVVVVAVLSHLLLSCATSRSLIQDSNCNSFHNTGISVENEVLVGCTTRDVLR
jgi:hypothetical protein